MELSRRKVFGGAAVLAAAGAFPGVSLALDSGDRGRLAGLLASGGTIEGQSFSFYDGQPLTIANAQGFRLKGCKFTWYGKAPKGYLAFGAKNGGRVQDCIFEHAEGAKKTMIIRKI